MLAIGNALALAGGPTVTEGIVSAKNRSLTAENDSGQTENLVGLHPDRRRHQPGQLGRPPGQRPGPGDRDEHRGGLQQLGQRPGPEHRVRHRHRLGEAPPGRAPPGRPGGAGNASPQPAPVANTAYMGVTVETVTPAVQQQDTLTPPPGRWCCRCRPGSPADQGRPPGQRRDRVAERRHHRDGRGPDRRPPPAGPRGPRLGGDLPWAAPRRPSTSRSGPARAAGRLVRAVIPGGAVSMTPPIDEPTVPEEGEEPPPPVGHVRVVYLGPVAPHWEVQSDFGDPTHRRLPGAGPGPAGAAAPPRPAVPAEP